MSSDFPAQPSGKEIAQEAVAGIAFGDTSRLCEQSFWELVEFLPQTVFEVDLQGRILFANRCGFETFGHSREDFERGVYATDLVVPEDRLRAVQILRELTERSTAGHEYTARRKDGTTFPALIYSTPSVRDGQRMGLRGLIVDLSEQKQAEARIRFSEERYRAIFENSGSAFLFVEEDSLISICNKAFETLAECARAEVENRVPWPHFVADPADLERMKGYHRRRLNREAGVPTSYEIRMRTWKGELRQVELTVSLIPDTAQSLVVITDVTEKHRAAQALKDSETLYRAIFENTGNASIIIEEDTTISLANSEWVRISGYSLDELVGRMSWTQFVVPEDLERMKSYHQARRMDETEAPWAYEFRFVNRRGEILDMINHVAMIPGTRRSIASLLDITARKRAEAEREQLRERLAQAEKLEAIGQLAGGVAHDFNNQLNAIMGFAELLDMSLEDEELQGYARLIGQACTQAADLTRKLLAFARKGKLLTVAVDIHRVIADVVALLQRSIDRRIEIVQHLNAPRSTVLGDPSQLQSALVNMAINARDAMPEGGTLTFTTELRALDREYCQNQPHEMEPGNFLHVSIRDTGTGMDAETCRRVFEPFFTTKGQGKGTGLGLASVYGTVKQHHGSIHVYSEPGRGSCFQVFLPLTDKQAAAAVPPRPVAEPGSARILLVDDEELTRAWVRGLLQNLGFHVTACCDGVEAVNFFRENWAQTDLVILDLIMPHVSGKDTFLALQAIHPGVKVIVASGFSLDGEAQSVMDAGAQGFLQKPFQGAELSALIKTVLNG